MRIAFVLLKRARRPIGGYKMVYDYANALAESGDTVEIIYDYSYNLSNRKNIPVLIKKIIYTFLYWFSKRWYHFSTKIFEKKVWDLNEIDLNCFDLAIATAAQTAEGVDRCRAKKKMYFIQGFENWAMPLEKLLETYRYSMARVVISKGLQNILKKYDASSTVISDGIDFQSFYETISQDKREKHTLAYMFHIDKVKGVKNGLEVIRRLKEKYPDMTVKMFGAYPKGNEVPEWVDYTFRATPDELRTIYNESQVFLSASIEEGFGLTGAESMACGCCLVSTRTQGALEYAEHGANAMLADVEDVDALVRHIETLFHDETLRMRISENGKKTIKENFNATESKREFVDFVHSYAGK